MKNQEQKAFQKDLIISLVLHLIFIGVFIYGLPSIFKKVPDQQNVITFEMLTVSDITNVRDQGVKTPEPKEIKKSQKIEKSAASPKENLEQKEETPKQEEPKPVEKKPETPKEEDKKKPAPIIKKEVKQPQAKKEETAKKAPKKQEDVIDSLLANLEKESEGTERRSPNRTPPSPPNEGKFAKGNNADEDEPLAVSEIATIKGQIKSNWNKPAGLEGIKVVLHLSLDIEGNATILGVSGLKGDKQLQILVEESARRAVKKANPIKNLRPERYNVWKEFNVGFEPSDF